MKIFLVLCFAIAAVSAQKFEHALKVRWAGPLNSESFYEIPRYLTDLVTLDDGVWKQYTRAESLPFPSLSLYCRGDDVTFCVKYDDTGYIVGLQIAVSKVAFTDNPFSLDTVSFSSWSVDGVEYWTQQQYFVSEDFLSLSAEEREEKRKAADYETLVEDALWLPRAEEEGGLMKVSKKEADVGETLFKKQACIPSMGLHYYYNMSSAIDCNALYPWFTLYNDDALVASGFMAFGTYPEVAEGKRMWFEQPSQTAVKLIVPDAPQCLYDISSKPGVITMHIYYTKKRAYSILCPLFG